MQLFGALIGGGQVFNPVFNPTVKLNGKSALIAVGTIMAVKLAIGVYRYFRSPDPTTINVIVRVEKIEVECVHRTENRSETNE